MSDESLPELHPDALPELHHDTLRDLQHELLRERARRLAQPVSSGGQDTADAVSFRLAGERYAIAAEHVAGVFMLSSLATVPGSAAVVVGLTEWRGDLLTLLDLRRLIGLSPAGLTDSAIVIVLGSGRPAFGILADADVGLMTIDTNELHPPAGGAARGGHALGLTPDAVTVLDAASLLDGFLRRSG